MVWKFNSSEGKLTRWEVKTLQRHVSDPWGCHYRSVTGVADAQMVQLHSVFPLQLFAGRKAREKLRRGPRVRKWSQGELLHQSSYGREALAKEPLRSLRSLCWMFRSLLESADRNTKKKEVIWKLASQVLPMCLLGERMGKEDGRLSDSGAEKRSNVLKPFG